jgi:hypothetical protein
MSAMAAMIGPEWKRYFQDLDDHAGEVPQESRTGQDRTGQERIRQEEMTER